MARGPGPAHLRPGRPPRGSDQPPPPPAPQARPGLTELVKVRLDAIVARHGAHQPRLQERAPLVDQAAVAAVVILGAGGQGRAGSDPRTRPLPSPLPCPRRRAVRTGRREGPPTRQMRPMRAYTAGLCGASAERSRKKKYSLSSLRSALSGMSSAWMNEGSAGRGGQRAALPPPDPGAPRPLPSTGLGIPTTSQTCPPGAGGLTVEPAGVVLVGAHGRLLAQRAEDGRVRAHEVDVHARIELLVCGRRGQSGAALCRDQSRRQEPRGPAGGQGLSPPGCPGHW